VRFHGIRELQQGLLPLAGGRGAPLPRERLLGGGVGRVDVLLTADRGGRDDRSRRRVDDLGGGICPPVDVLAADEVAQVSLTAQG
jgi:hypothetical protein